MYFASVYLHQLTLTQFRNYTHLAVEFSPFINCLIGVNGVGKTNVLDALYCLAITRSFRSSQDKHLVKEGETFFFIEGNMKAEEESYLVQCNYIQGKGKKILVNKSPLERNSEHLGRIPLVAILPNDTQLINGAAADRRKFLDLLISQYNKAYLYHLIQYDKILSQRNALLKQFQELRFFDQEQLDLWNFQLIPHGQAIGEVRRQFIKDFQPIFNQYFAKIVADAETPAIHYKTQVTENSEAGWQELLRERTEKDRINGYTTAGIHRDDLQFHINGQVLKSFGSQGQQKTFAISLKLAQYFLLSERANAAPILLLDDIFDKLDPHRLKRIGEMVEREIPGQVFITDTSFERLKEAFSPTQTDREVWFFSVTPGTLKRMDNEK